MTKKEEENLLKQIELLINSLLDLETSRTPSIFSSPNEMECFEEIKRCMDETRFSTFQEKMKSLRRTVHNNAKKAVLIWAMVRIDALRIPSQKLITSKGFPIKLLIKDGQISKQDENEFKEWQAEKRQNDLASLPFRKKSLAIILDALSSSWTDPHYWRMIIDAACWAVYIEHDKELTMSLVKKLRQLYTEEKFRIFNIGTRLTVFDIFSGQ